MFNFRVSLKKGRAIDIPPLTDRSGRIVTAQLRAFTGSLVIRHLSLQASAGFSINAEAV